MFKKFCILCTLLFSIFNSCFSIIDVNYKGLRVIDQDGAERIEKANYKDDVYAYDFFKTEITLIINNNTGTTLTIDPTNMHTIELVAMNDDGDETSGRVKNALYFDKSTISIAQGATENLILTIPHEIWYSVDDEDKTIYTPFDYLLPQDYCIPIVIRDSKNEACMILNAGRIREFTTDEIDKPHKYSKYDHAGNKNITNNNFETYKKDIFNRTFYTNNYYRHRFYLKYLEVQFVYFNSNNNKFNANTNYEYYPQNNSSPMNFGSHNQFKITATTVSDIGSKPLINKNKKASMKIFSGSKSDIGHVDCTYTIDINRF